MVTPSRTPFETGPSWHEQDERLRELWMGHMGPPEIAEVLGRTVSAIMTRAARLGLPRRMAPGRKMGYKLKPKDSFVVSSAPRTPVYEAVKVPTVGEITSTRVCLMCLSKFESAGRHNRICAPCKGSADYVRGSTLPDITISAG